MQVAVKAFFYYLKFSSQGLDEVKKYATVAKARADAARVLKKHGNGAGRAFAQIHEDGRMLGTVSINRNGRATFKKYTF